MKKINIEEVASPAFTGKVFREEHDDSEIYAIYWRGKKLYFMEEYIATDLQKFEDLDKKTFWLSPTSGWKSYLENNNIKVGPNESNRRTIYSKYFSDNLEAREEVIKQFLAEMDHYITEAVASAENSEE